jgi:uncharacterized protein (DUF4415 family)
MSGESTTRAVLTQDGDVLIEQPDGSYRKAAAKTSWQQVNALTEEEIDAAARDDADAPPLDDAFWANARIVMPQEYPKKHRGLQLDAEVIDWFEAQGPGWQNRVNAVLRSYIEAQKKHGPGGP